MSPSKEKKFQVITSIQRRTENPLMIRNPLQTVLVTTGRTSGLARRTPIGGRRVGRTFWFVAAHGHRANYVRNIEKNPEVRLRHHGRWYTGTAYPMPDDDPIARMKMLPRVNSALARVLGTGLMTIRVDLTK
ncbi:nitroreductase/quinone reductase family protein [Streptomyces sp. NPDC051976]|uniref:nitroreductase/quinone reductase family protein n=1 Tax=Streptomyces sp. NPDC051976 TaxID=3154947 RepID=UPI00342D3DC5